MDCETEISLRVEKIRTVFQAAKELGSLEKDLTILIKQLDANEPEFCSIAYEGASMGIALRDLEKHGTLSDWRLFNDKAGMHAAQTHAGLGWAVAQTNKPVSDLLKTLSPLLRFRVIDGLGYYDGVFRQRTSIKAQNVSEGIEEWMLPAYNQGIGRSIWYACKGNVTKVAEMISAFPNDRQAAMWIGIGVACSYVGGCDENLLRSLFLISGNYQDQLAIGAVLSARARVQAHAITDDVELACRIWCDRSAKEAMLLSVKAEPKSYDAINDSYALWLMQIQQALVITQGINKV